MTEAIADQELLGAVRAGSLVALGELYQRHGAALHALAFRITGSRDDAEDVLQDVFVGLPRALRSYREQGQFNGWLRRVTARTALLRLRARRRRRDVWEAAAATGQASPDPVDRIGIERALARLPDSLRVVFLLKQVEGYSHQEIAALLGVSAGASATRFSRALERLREELRS